MKEVEVGGGRGARQDSTFSPVLETLALTHLSFSVADPPPGTGGTYMIVATRLKGNIKAET